MDRTWEYVAEVVCLVGLPASGKSTWAKKAAEKVDKSIIISSDEIRRELYGDESVQKNPEKVFEIAHGRIREALNNGYMSIYFDATNLNAKRRKHFVESLPKWCVKSCYLCVAPIEELIYRDWLRERSVGEEVIRRMATQFQMPMWDEGWDTIEIVSEHSVSEEQIKARMRNFDQKNSHHNFTLLEHCEAAESFVKSNLGFDTKADEVAFAALMHDCGKLDTQVFFNTKGEPTEEAHYHGHANYGAYLICCIPTHFDNVYAAQLVAHHMDFFSIQPGREDEWYEKMLFKYGPKFVHHLDIIHSADFWAH